MMTFESVRAALSEGGHEIVLSFLVYMAITAMMSYATRDRPTHLDMADKCVDLYKSMDEIKDDEDCHEREVLASLKAKAFEEARQASAERSLFQRFASFRFTGSLFASIEIASLNFFGVINIQDLTTQIFVIFVIFVCIVLDLTLWNKLRTTSSI